MKKLIYIGVFAAALLFIAGAEVTQAFASESSTLEVFVSSKAKTYKFRDTLKIKWTPSSVRIDEVKLVPLDYTKSDIILYSGFYDADGNKISGNTYNYVVSYSDVPSGKYYIKISTADRAISAVTREPIEIKSSPTLFFGGIDGEVNRMNVTPGKTVTLKWDATSVDKCKAKSHPRNSRWNGTKKSVGTQEITVTKPTTFYLSCRNNLKEVKTAFFVDTQTSKVKAKLVPSSTFTHSNYKLGTTQGEALTHSPQISLFNSSETETIYYRVLTNDQPKWVNTSYNTAQMSIEPLGVVGIGAFSDPSTVSKTGTYKWDLRLEGNFVNSPVIIPVTMNVLP